MIAQLRKAETGTTSSPLFIESAHVSTASINDISQIDKLFRCQTDSVQLTLSRFSAEAQAYTSGGLSVTAVRSRAGYQIRSSIPSAHAVFAYARSSGGFMMGARNCAAMRDIAIAREATLEMRTTGAADLVWIDIDLFAFPELAPFLPPAGQTLLLTSPDRRVHLELNALIDLLAGNPARAALGGEAERSRAERELIVRIGRALRRLSVKPGPTKRERHREDLARRVESFMWDNIEEHITLSRICRSIGCRTRSAIYCFKDLFGVGPVTYLKIRRLSAVHRRLQERDLSLRIIDIAADFGFWHMGHFSSDYKRMFGKTASETVVNARQPVLIGQ